MEYNVISRLDQIQTFFFDESSSDEDGLLRRVLRYNVAPYFSFTPSQL